jgi:hypothetical protein
LSILLKMWRGDAACCGVGASLALVECSLLRL